MKINSMTISSFNPHGGSYDAKGETEKLLKELTEILDQLKPQDADNYHSIWISAPRPTFRQYYNNIYEHDYPFKEAKDDIIESAKQNYEDSYPDAKVWFRISTKHFKQEKEFYAFFINQRAIFTINDNNSNKEYDGKDLLLWAIDGAKRFVASLRNGKLTEYLNLIPYSYRYGNIQRKDYWDIIPSERASFFIDYPEEEVKKFLLIFDEKRIVNTPIVKMTARQYYEACATVYHALGFMKKKPIDFNETEEERRHYNKERFTPRELYYTYADGRDNGLRNVPLDDSDAFSLWCREKGPYFEFNGAHPWEIIPSFSFFHSMHLFPIFQPDGTIFLSLSGDSSIRAPETIIAVNALANHGYPIRVFGFKTIKDRLSGLDSLSVYPKNCYSTADDFIHLPDGLTGKAVIEKTKWENYDYQLTE